MQRWIIHADMDAFYASVEILDNPALKGKPVIVGGSSNRGVVSTCSYEARRFGVHSAMSIVEARRLCPQGIYLPVRMARYLEMSKKIMAIFHEISPLVEQLSVDEAFLDMTGTEGLYGSIENAGRLIKKRVKDELGLTVSVGLAPNKFLAKLASDLEKPDGFTIIPHEKAADIIAPMPVNKIFGIGQSTVDLLKKYNIYNIKQLRMADKAVLQKIFGKSTESVCQKAWGIDHRPVVPESVRKSVGRETTFDRDLQGLEECRPEILKLAEQVGYRLRKHGFCGNTLTLKVKYNDFKQISRNTTSETDIIYDEDIFRFAMGLLQNISFSKGIRLLGITVSNLNQGSLSFDFEDDEKKKRRNNAVDALKERFGFDVIMRGTTKKK